MSEGNRLLPSKGELQDTLADYVFKVLDAVGLRYGQGVPSNPTEAFWRRCTAGQELKLIDGGGSGAGKGPLPPGLGGGQGSI